jgi:RNA polymerase sigma-70 factor, ECF subfamily
MVAKVSPTDERVAELCAQGRGDLAAAKVLEAHGGEVMRFLVGRARDHQLASDAFSAFSEDLCRGLPGFHFACSVRTWIFTIAHHALARTRRGYQRDRTRGATLSSAEARSGIASPERTATPPYLRTDVKTRVRELRSRLPEEDQLLIELRTALRFGWRDIARILLGSESAPTGEIVDREAARLRKRFQLATHRLRELAIEEGILRDAERD